MRMKSKTTNICIIHYNTPEMTECLIKSINKSISNVKIYIFDNSDRKPFIYRQENLIYLDNTKGEYINFNNELSKYKLLAHGTAYLNNYISAKHCLSVQKCIDLINENFILLDSDVLIKKDISKIIDNDSVFVGSVEFKENSKPRVLPYMLFINVKLCERYNIKFFNPNFMHGLTNSESNKYDTGAYFFEACKEYHNTEIDIEEYIVHYKAGSWLEDAKKYIKYEQIPQDMWLNNNRKYWQKESHKNKIVVYTAITGSYDKLLLHSYIDDNFDFVCFTDDETLESGLYDIRPVPEELKSLSLVKQQRCIKINPHKYLPEYDISIWLDGNVELLGNPMELIDNEHCIFIPQHPLRNSIYTEGIACINAKKDTPENINRQLNYYFSIGYPNNDGLVQSNIVIRKHNDPKCIKLMEDWWKEVKEYSHRDQLSFNYALWKNPDTEIKLLDKNIYRSKYFYWNKGHGNKIEKNKVDTVKFSSAVKAESPYDIIGCKPISTKPVTITTKVIPHTIKKIFY